MIHGGLYKLGVLKLTGAMLTSALSEESKYYNPGEVVQILVRCVHNLQKFRTLNMSDGWTDCNG